MEHLWATASVIMNYERLYAKYEGNVKYEIF